MHRTLYYTMDMEIKRMKYVEEGFKMADINLTRAEADALIAFIYAGKAMAINGPFRFL